MQMSKNNSGFMWQQQLRDVITDPIELCQQLALSPSDTENIVAACRLFPLRVPRQFVARMQRGNPQDPLLLQVLPQAAELQTRVGYVADPLHERDYTPIPGLLHKYPGRVLLIMAGSCAINCRYCFRRHFPYRDNLSESTRWQKILEYIQADASITEVIFSGGEPLLLKDALIKHYVQSLSNIPHLQRLRWHTRLPIVVPERITVEFIDAIQSRLRPVMVLHSNHAHEIDAGVAKACQRLATANVTLLNQAVLLAGINADAKALSELSEQLFSCGVLPYYLHLLDPVAGTAHFAVTVTEAKALLGKLKTMLPGFLVPKLAQEIPGELAKQTY